MSLSKQGRPLDDNIRKKIVNLWMSGEDTATISKRFDIPFKTISNITDLFVRNGSTKPKQAGNHTRTTRTDDTIEYVEYGGRSLSLNIFDFFIIISKHFQKINQIKMKTYS